MMNKITKYIFPSIPVIFKSDYSMLESINRLQAATKRSILSSLFRQSAVGRVDKEQVRLERVIPFFGNSFKPIFIGSFVQKNEGVFLEGRWTTFSISKIINSVGFVFITVWTLVASIITVRSIIACQENLLSKVETYFPLIGVGFLIIEILFIRFSWWLSRKDIDFLTNIITKALSNESQNKVATADRGPLGRSG